MSTTPLTTVVGHLRRSVQADSGLSDGQLLNAYVACRDEAAFECLVWRHGPAVLGACRRLLANEADAEDAFQATFLVLVRKAASVHPCESIGAWLYGVACNVARKARADVARRQAKELSAARIPKPTAPDPDLRPTIDLEVNRLPDKYRVPIVMCELEEQPIAEAARQLGWPQGTVASRLARGRDLLKRRLARRGLVLAGLSPVPLTADSVAGVLRAIHGPGATATALAQSVLRAMFLTKLKVVSLMAVCTFAVVLGGVLLPTAFGTGQKGPTPMPIRTDEKGVPAREKAEDVIAWGNEKDGVRFGLALGKGQSPRIHIGERARFRIMARNTTDKPVTVGTLQVLQLPMFAEPTVSSKGDEKDLAVNFVRGPRVSPPAPNLKIGSNEVIELTGEFVLPFLPHRAEVETNVVAREGKWTLAFPKLDTWTAGAGWGTGGLDIEIVTGDVVHSDSQRIAWGPVAEGLQFGLRPDKPEYTIGDTVKFAVHARNMTDKEITFAFPTLSGWWPNNGRPVVKDSDGKDVKPSLAVPPGPIGPQAVSKHTVKPGETIEVVVVAWPFIDLALPGMYKVDHVVIEKPGVYTFQYPDLHAKIKPAWPTGAARLEFRKPDPGKK